MTHHANVLFIGAEDEENLAIRSLAAFLLEKGVRASVAGFSQPQDTATILQRLRRDRPDILASSVAFQCKADIAFDMLRAVRAAGYRGHIVIGGHFPTFEFRTILQTQPAIDSVLRFEGEHGIVQLVDAVINRAPLDSVPNLVHRAPAGIVENPCVHDFMDLDKLPLPLRSRRAQRRLGERFASLVSSRGCWHSSCVYCCIGAFHRQKKTKFALRSAAGVADEIARLHRDLRVNLMQFHDDNFVLATPQLTCQRLNDLRHEIESRNVPISQLAFLIKARPDVVDDSVAQALDDLGCVGVFLGVENATATGLRALCRGADMNAVERSLECLSRRGMGVTYNLLVFHPHATIDEIRANLAFVRRHPASPFDFGRAEIVAGSPLEKLVIAEDLRCGQWPMWDYRLCDPAVQRAFDINRATFRSHESHYSILMHTLIALCYHAGVVKRLHAGSSASAIGAAVTDLIAQTNLFIVERIERMLDLAQREADETAAAELGETLDAGCRRYLRHAYQLKGEMHRLQAAEHVFQRFGIRPLLQELPLAGLFGVRRGAATKRN